MDLCWESELPFRERELNWYLTALRKYAVFEGRARRKEFWFFVLFYLLFYLLVVIVDRVFGTYDVEWDVGLFEVCYSLAFLIPYLAVAVRRLHDTERSGWWIFIALIPIGGIVWLIVLLSLDGDSGENRFGADPKLEY